MDKYVYLFTAIIVPYAITIRGMDSSHASVLIITSDDKQCILPQWKIENSRTLHIKQEFQKFKEKYYGALPMPIVLKTINEKSLKLYSDALDAPNLPLFIKKLSSQEQTFLLPLAGKQQLDCPYISYQFLDILLPSEWIKKNINLWMSKNEIALYLQGLAIRDTCENKSFTPTEITEHITYLEHNHHGNYNNIPHLLSPDSNFSGITFETQWYLSPNSKIKWVFENYTNKIPGREYILTPTKPVGQESLSKNKKILWCIEKDLTLRVIIKHTDPIEYSAFSDDTKYLATVSFGNCSELWLTDLTIEKNELTGCHEFTGYHARLMDNVESIDSISFNDQSTILAAALNGCIYFWNTQKSNEFITFDCPAGITHTIHFYCHDDRLLTITNRELLDDVITIWDINDINKCTKIKSIIIPNCPKLGSTIPLKNILSIETEREVFLLNGISGEIIMQTGIINNAPNVNEPVVNSTFIPLQPILITQTTNNNPESNECNVALWDINSGKRIATLLEHKQSLLGVGSTPTGQSIILTKNPQGIIQIDLYGDVTAQCLDWIIHKSNLLQHYLLHRLCRAHKNNDPVTLCTDSADYRILQNLEIDHKNVKTLVEKYFLKK